MYVGVTVDAIRRAHQHREGKFALIKAANPEWEDLWEQWFASGAAED
jgi:predicted GIY-YIG superfamily endonuclease